MTLVCFCCRKALSYSGPLQVVPDIDDENNESRQRSKATDHTDQASHSHIHQHPHPSHFHPYPTLSHPLLPPGLSELERKLLCIQSDFTEPPKVRTMAPRFLPRTESPSSTVTTVTRLNRDAQRLSPAELHWFQHMAQFRRQPR
jgi:hypothetical protein